MRIGWPGHARLSVRHSPLVRGRFSFQDEAAGSSPARPTTAALGCGNACRKSPLVAALHPLPPHTGLRAHPCAVLYPAPPHRSPDVGDHRTGRSPPSPPGRAPPRAPGHRPRPPPSNVDLPVGQADHCGGRSRRLSAEPASFNGCRQPVVAGEVASAKRPTSLGRYRVLESVSGES
jgi:hypothetical protein